MRKSSPAFALVALLAVVNLASPVVAGEKRVRQSLGGREHMSRGRRGRDKKPAHKHNPREAEGAKRDL